MRGGGGITSRRDMTGNNDRGPMRAAFLTIALCILTVTGVLVYALGQAGPGHAQANTSTVTIRTNQASVHEGGLATFIVERYSGGIAPLTVEVKTWEPNLEDAEGDNPSEQVHEVPNRSWVEARHPARHTLR